MRHRVLLMACLLGLGLSAQASVGESAKPAPAPHDSGIEVKPVPSKEAYEALLAKFDKVSKEESPMAYAALVGEPVLGQQGDTMYNFYHELLKSHIKEDPRAALLYAALLGAQARKPLVMMPGDGMTPERQAMWQQLPATPLFQEANALLIDLCQKQNLQACMARFYELFDAGSPVMMGHDEKEQQAFLRTLVEAENEVRRIAIMNYAKQPTPGLAGFVSTLYERGLTPFPAEQAKGMGFVRDADKAAQWQKHKEGKK